MDVETFSIVPNLNSIRRFRTNTNTNEADRTCNGRSLCRHFCHVANGNKKNTKPPSTGVFRGGLFGFLPEGPQNLLFEVFCRIWMLFNKFQVKSNLHKTGTNWSGRICLLSGRMTKSQRWCISDCDLFIGFSV